MSDSIDTNNDLKIIFDYVNEKHSNQGIIVLEDFDTMNDIVSKRKIVDKDNYDNNIMNMLDKKTMN